MPDYDSDILAWSERQASLLRRHAAGELVDETELDWPNIAEEIESVGQGQLSAVRSHLVQALLQDLKAEAWPLSRDVPHWRAEARGHRAEAAERFTPAMRQKIDLDKIYRRALRAMPDQIDGQPPVTDAPQRCSMTLDELLSEEPRQ